ncbi:MAG TPA: hypothetical protein VG013_08385 [Gemmataceae bacterium]|jgi:hypothetical protein|nr:hypothetical protein [Gemmataceae bacterium]
MMPSLLKSRRAWALAAMLCLPATIEVCFTWYLTAYARGGLMAYIDNARGHPEIKVFGYRQRRATNQGYTSGDVPQPSKGGWTP